MMVSWASRSAVTDTTAESGPILAEVGQLVDIFDSARGFEHQRLEARCNWGSELEAQRFGAGDQFLRIGYVGRRDLVQHFGGGVAQHPLRTDIEQLNDALLVGGDAGEVRAVEDCVLQGPRFEQSCFAPDFGDGFRLARVAVEKSGAVDLPGHGCLRSSRRAPACLQRLEVGRIVKLEGWIAGFTISLPERNAYGT